MQNAYLENAEAKFVRKVILLNTYWFAGWLAENDIHDASDVARRLSTQKAIDGLLSVAPDTVYGTRSEIGPTFDLVGGKGVDLTGDLTCAHPDCVRREVDVLFRRAWHYFDRVIVPDQAIFRVTDFRRNNDREWLIRALTIHAEIVLYLQEIKADEFISFEIRSPSCDEHWKQHAHEADIEQVIPNVAKSTAVLTREAAIGWRFEKKSGHRHVAYRLDHRWFEHTVFQDFCTKRFPFGSSAEAHREMIARHTILTFLAGLSADAVTARRMKSPLGATVRFYRELLATHPSPSVEEVAFELELPVLENVPLEVLIRLRRDDRDLFERFQLALRSAISQRLKTAQDEDAPTIAAEIRMDVIQRELNSIRARLEAARNLAFLSSLPGLVLGAAATTVGFLGHVPPLLTGPVEVGGAFLGLQGVGKAAVDYFSARTTVAASDMYFLWKAHEHAI